MGSYQRQAECQTEAGSREVLQIGPEMDTAGSMLQTADSPLLDLPDPFTGKIEPFPNLVQGQSIVLIDTEIHPDNRLFTIL